MIDGPQGDVQAALASVKEALSAGTVWIGEEEEERAGILRVPEDHQVRVFNAESFASQPHRHIGSHSVFSGASFVEAVKRRMGSPLVTGIYVDADALNLTAVLNDDIGGPHWRDYRVDLRVKPTPEWTFWTSHAELTSQVKFAETVEEGQPHIVAPAAADMLDMAQTFAATIDGKFAQGGNLKNGSRQLLYEENVSATVGKSVVVPDSFTVRVVPFLGASEVDVPCLIRYRIADGKLSIGYKILNVDDYKRAAFAEIVDGVRADLDLPDVPFIDGSAGQARTPAPVLT